MDVTQAGMKERLRFIEGYTRQAYLSRNYTLRAGASG